MKKNLLLVCGLFFGLAGTVSAQKTILFEDFEGAIPEKQDSTKLGWYGFYNTPEFDERNLSTEYAWSGSQSLHFYNDITSECEDQNWMRAVKFRNLPLKENTSYRVSFYLQGTNSYTVDGTTEKKTKARVALMQGQEYGDIALITADSTQQTYDLSYFQEEDKGFKKYTMMFFYANQALQQEYYKNHPGSLEGGLIEKFFLTINMMNPGDFYIDDVKVEEGAEIAGISYNCDVLKVDFGYDVNVKELVPEGKERALLPNDCVTVGLADGSKTYEVLSVEAWKDGSFYIFLGDEYPEEEDAANLVVTFKNPTDEAYRVKYTSTRRPYSTTEDTSVKDFTEKGLTYDSNISEVYSYAHKVPTLMSAVPEDGSFDLPADTKSFTMTFDKKVNTAEATAKLVDESGKAEALTVGPEEMAEVVTLTRTATTSLSGEYKLVISNVLPEVDAYDEPGEYTVTLNFGASSADPSDVAKVLWTDSFSVSGSNKIPAGWVINAANSEILPGDYYNGPRVFDGFSGDLTHALYYRMGYTQYGAVPDDNVHVITLEAGKKYQISFNAFAWKGTPYGRFQVLDASDNAVYTADFQNVANPNGDGAKGNVAVGAQTHTVKVEATGNYKLRWMTLKAEGGEMDTENWTEALLGNVKLQYVPNTAGAIYKQQLADALAAAKNTLNNNTGLRYAGAAYDALDAAIKAYDGKAYTAPSAYEAAVKALNDAALAMTNHRTLCDTYDGKPAAAYEQVVKFRNSKFAAADYYKALVEAANKYVLDIQPDQNLNDSIAKIDTLMLDSQLEEAIALLDKTTNMVKSMCTTLDVDAATGMHKASQTTSTTGVAALTARHIYLADALADLNKKTGKEEYTEFIEQANNLLTDNDDVAETLKSAVWHKVYSTLADPSNTLFAEKLDSVTMENYRDSINMTGFLKNPNTYLTATGKYEGNAGVVPGWIITDKNDGYEVATTTGWSNVINETCPYADGMISCWTRGFVAQQTVTGLPAGVYSVVIGFGERQSDVSSLEGINAFVAQGADTVRVQAPIIGQTFPYGNMYMGTYTVTDGTLTLGVETTSNAHVFFNNAEIYMVNAAPGYNYATGINGVAEDSKAEVVRVEFYDMNGRRVNGNLNGLGIKKEVLANGKVVVKKILK